MTCIVAVKSGGGIYVGGDSAAVADPITTVTGRPKVFRRGPYLFGYTHSFRMGQLLEFVFQPPDREQAEDPFAFMVTKFVPAVRACFKAEGFATVSNNVESGGSFIVAAWGRLFEIASDYQVLEPGEVFTVVGQGWAVARGALHACEATGILRDAPESSVRMALAAAARFCTGVREPFHVLVEVVPRPDVAPTRPPLPPPREIREGYIPKALP
jgi:hypothetical protein